MKRSFIVSILLALATCWYTTTNAQVRVGDPGVMPDQSAISANSSQWPQMDRWSKAGVEGGIPFASSLEKGATVTNKTSDGINNAINSCSAGEYVYLPNGNYDITSTVKMKSGVSLVGESKTGVKCIIDMSGETDAFYFYNVNSCGIYNLTIEGSWGEPQYDWNEHKDYNEELPDVMVVSVKMKGDTENCWLDGVKILNSARHPLIVDGDHCTIRDCYIKGAHNKSGGYQGYFHVRGADNLICYNYVTQLRHISMQDPTSTWNVWYGNEFLQEISFHNDDDGENLITHNNFTLPKEMSDAYVCIMGTWSTQHEKGEINYIYKNKMLEENWGGLTPWSDDNIVYYGPFEEKPSDEKKHDNFGPCPTGTPVGGELYAVILGDPVDVTGVSVTPATESVEVFETVSLLATVSPSDASNKSIMWTSSDETIAIVNTSGEVFGLSQGNVTITAKTADGNFTDNCRLTITPATKPGNVAQYKTATAIGDDGNVPAGAIDGDVDTRWSNEAMPSWIEIDLGTLKSISSTEVICYKDRAYQYIVEAKANAGDAYVQIVDRSSNTTPGSVSSPIVDNFTAMDARYVKVTFTGADAYTGSWTSIQEIRVMGMDAGSTPSEPEEPIDPEQPTNPYEDWNLVWHDEFDGSGSPDASKWEVMEYNRRNNDDGPDGWWERDDAYLDGDGSLVIRCRKVDNRNNDGDAYDYNVGAVRTKDIYEKKFGRFEINCKIPREQGWWVAFWMMQGDVNAGIPATAGQEVDIMEAWGWTEDINQALHWGGYGDEHQVLGNRINIPGLKDGYHTYTLDWFPDKYVFYVDGEVTWTRTTNICQEPGYIKVTGEISTESWAIGDNWSRNPAEANFPDYFLVDYVRVYDYVGTGEEDNDQVVLNPIHDAYIQGGAGTNNSTLKIESGNRVSYLMYDLSTVQGTIESASLQITCDGDGGNGEIQVAKGDQVSWTEGGLSSSNAPQSVGVLGGFTGTYNVGSSYTATLDVSQIEAGEKLSLILSQVSGSSDAWFSSKEGSAAPVLVLTMSEAAPVSDGGLIVNAGFETGDLSSWTTAGTTSATSDAHSGEYAAKVQDAGQFYQIIELEANTTYTASCYAKVGAAGESVFFGVTNNTTGVLVKNVKVEGTSYAQQSITFTTGADVEDYKIWFWNNTGGQYFADDFQLVESVATNMNAQGASDLKVYPNPFVDVISLSGVKAGVINIISTTGQVVYQEELSLDEVELDLSHLLRGIYFVQFEASAQAPIKIIKR